MDEFTLGRWNPSVDTLGSMFESSLNFGVLNVPAAPNTLATVPSNALQSMAPVSDAGADSWSGFWKDLTRGVVGYAIAKDAAQSGISMTPGAGSPVEPGAVVQAPRAQAGGNPLVLLLLAGVAFLALK